MSKHTPGPWEVRYAANGSVHGIVSRGQESIPGGIKHIVYQAGIGMPASDEGKANAWLIAAAPDLLAAAKAQHEIIDILMAALIGLDKTLLPSKQPWWGKFVAASKTVRRVEESL